MTSGEQDTWGLMVGFPAQDRNFSFFFFKIPDWFLGHTQPPIRWPPRAHIPRDGTSGGWSWPLSPPNAHFKNQRISAFIPSCVLMLCTVWTSPVLIMQIKVYSAKNCLLLRPLSPTRNQWQWIPNTNQILTVPVIGKIRWKWRSCYWLRLETARMWIHITCDRLQRTF